MILLISILMMATVMDVQTGCIRNSFILISFGAALIHQILVPGIQAVPISLLGILFSILLLFPLFMIKGLGAGDVKLFGIIGCFLTICQYREILILIFLSLIIGLIQAMILSGVTRKFQRKIHFSIPILISTIIYTGGFY